jgi:hypothetical protein
MGVAPEAIVEYLYSNIGSKILACHMMLFLHKTMLPYILFLSGARSALLMGVVREAMIGC